MYLAGVKWFSDHEILLTTNFETDESTQTFSSGEVEYDRAEKKSYPVVWDELISLPGK